MAKQSTLNSKLVIIIVDHGGHFWQWFNLNNTKGHICQIGAGKPQSTGFQNTSHHICESVCKTARYKTRGEKEKINCYCMPLPHSPTTMDITFGWKTWTEKDFVSKLQKSTYTNVQNSGCFWSPRTQTSLWFLCCKSLCRRPELSLHGMKSFALPSLPPAFILLIFMLAPLGLPWLLSRINVTRCRFWDYLISALVQADKLLAELLLGCVNTPQNCYLYLLWKCEILTTGEKKREREKEKRKHLFNPPKGTYQSFWAQPQGLLFS